MMRRAWDGADAADDGQGRWGPDGLWAAPVRGCPVWVLFCGERGEPRPSSVVARRAPLLQHRRLLPSMSLAALLREYRPFLVALIAVALFWLLLKPRHKPPGSERTNQQGGSAAASGSKGSSKGPMLSISTVGTLIEFRGRVPQLLPGAAAALLQIAARADVYLVTTLPEDSDELEQATLECLEAAGLFGPAGVGCDRRKAMFCVTEDGRGAIARQLTPAVHLDTSAAVIGYLQPHLPRVIYVAADGLPPAGVPCAACKSLASYADAAFAAPAKV